MDPPPPTPVPKDRKTYPRDWPNYNRAQIQEKSLFLRLLKSLTDTVENEVAKGPGRPKIALGALTFAAIYQVYSRMSARRFGTDIELAYVAGLISDKPHFNSVLNAMNHAGMTQVLLNFVAMTSAPLKDFEHTFAADSSGFTSSVYERWIDIKTAALRAEHTWTKVHLMVGTYSHIVTAVVIKEQDASDTKQFPALLDKTAKNFNVREVCADKAYGSISNYQKCAEHEAVPYILFKSNHTGSGKGTTGKEAKTEGGKLWQKMFHAFQYHRDDFLLHYHQRSNVETVFSMIKRKFGGNVRNRKEVAALNEVLCKIVCHNICVLIHAMFELGLNLDDLLAPKVRRPNLQIIEGGLNGK